MNEIEKTIFQHIYKRPATDEDILTMKNMMDFCTDCKDTDMYIEERRWVVKKLGINNKILR